MKMEDDIVSNEMDIDRLMKRIDDRADDAKRNFNQLFDFISIILIAIVNILDITDVEAVKNEISEIAQLGEQASDVLINMLKDKSQNMMIETKTKK
jgi:hypothetical protein